MIVDRMDSRLELINIQWATALIVFVATCLLTINNADIAQAAPGDLDLSFDFDGKVTTSIGSGNDEAHAVAIQSSDGKIVVAGHTQNNGQFDIVVARYNADGSLDNSFGNSGVVTTPVGGNNDEAYGVAIQGDGKIVVAGLSLSGTHDIALVRYNADGSLDTSFDFDGKVTTSIGSGNDEAHAVAIQSSDGKIVVAGHTQNNGQFDIVVARYNADGSLDNSFGTGGIVTTPIDVSTGDDEAYGVAIQSDGKIVLAGHTENNGQFNIAVVRYNTDGNPDTSFGNSGVVTTPIGIGSSDDEAYGVRIQGDGKIVVAGRSEQGGTFDIALVRYLTAADSGSGGGDSSTNGGGGGCTLNPRGGFDFALISLVGLVLVYLGWKSLRKHLMK